MPMIVRPLPTTIPKAIFTATCVRKYLLRLFSGVVDGCRRPLDVMRTGEADQSVAQVLSLKKNKYDKDDDYANRHQGMH